MNSYSKSIVPIVESKYDSFTTVEKNVADFFLNNRRKMDFSARNVAKEYLYQKHLFPDLQKNAVFMGIGNSFINMRRPLHKKANLWQTVPEWF